MAFKQCPKCKTAWESRDAFIQDRSLDLNGYKADFEELEFGLFFFTHLVPECKSTMAIEAAEFLDLYKGPVYPTRKTLTEECPRYCTTTGQLKRCEALCECAFVREIIRLIKAAPA